MRILLLFTIILSSVFTQTAHASIDNGNNYGCTPIITTDTTVQKIFCAGSIIRVPFRFTDCVFPTNIFTVELSDASGSFGAPVTIGTFISTVADTIFAIIPNNTVSGTNYRVRVVSSNPASIGSDNGQNLTVLPKPISDFNINSPAQCINGNNFIYTNNSSGSIASYQWNLGDGTASSLTIVNHSYAKDSTFNVKLKTIGLNGCADSITKFENQYLMAIKKKNIKTKKTEKAKVGILGEISES